MTDLLKSVLFLNIIVLDGTQGVKKAVKEKIDKTNMPQPIKDAAKKIGAKAASKLATPTTIATKMSQEMPKKMPLEMAEKGMTVTAEAVFQEGPYVVIQLQVQKLNSVLMAEVKALEDKETDWTWLIRLLTWFLSLLGATHQKTLEEEYLPRIVQAKMEPMMNEMLKVRLEEEMKMEATTQVLGEEKQARYFFQKLKEIRKDAKKGK
ncbi:expressed unknown protein [Seminavis robusta]|uniref:Uncharacterized protein n=1 Tax=Seminavis robusta TaxID=568900 RepID=A0A9N8D604_9STRA|nr:expressed unknown protein [Seminavis robusta]|eukprot:Sro13_g010020.1 n/a (207) ;mRNA; r:100824-101699